MGVTYFSWTFWQATFRDEGRGVPLSRIFHDWGFWSLPLSLRLNFNIQLHGTPMMGGLVTAPLYFSKYPPLAPLLRPCLLVQDCPHHHMGQSGFPPWWCWSVAHWGTFNEGGRARAIDLGLKESPQAEVEGGEVGGMRWPLSAPQAPPVTFSFRKNLKQKVPSLFIPQKIMSLELKGGWSVPIDRIIRLEWSTITGLVKKC